jgi:[acyl-carrier-protein] S-malonyltransferase
VGLGACAALAAEQIEPAFAAGHSLGELTAWAAAGAIGARDAIGLAGVRGRVMEREAIRYPGRMLAVTVERESQVAELLALGRVRGAVSIAAHNTPTEWTLTGDERALAAIAARASSTRLPVSGAWHSPAMAGAVPDFLAALQRTRVEPERAAVVANRDGTIVSSVAMRDLLAGQLVRPVQWATSMRTLASSGITHYVVLGPSKLPRRLICSNLGPGARVVVVESYADVAPAVTELRG